MFHQHHDALDPGHQVHGAAHALDHLAGHHPVGQVTLGGHLHGTEHGQVDVPAADHRERIVTAEVAGAGARGHGLLAGIDQVGIQFRLGGERADAQ